MEEISINDDIPQVQETPKEQEWPNQIVQGEVAVQVTSLNRNSRVGNVFFEFDVELPSPWAQDKERILIRGLQRSTFDLQRLHDYLTRFHAEIFLPAMPPVALVAIGQGDERLKYYIARFLHRLLSDVRLRESDICKQFLRPNTAEFTPSLDLVTGVAHAVDAQGNIIPNSSSDQPLALPIPAPSTSTPSSLGGFMKSLVNLGSSSPTPPKDHDPFFDTLLKQSEARNKALEKVRQSCIDVAGRYKQLSLAERELSKALVWGSPENAAGSGLSGIGNGLLEGGKWNNAKLETDEQDWIAPSESLLRAFASYLNQSSQSLAQQSDFFAGDVSDSITHLIYENKCLNRLLESRSEAMNAYSTACTNTQKRLANLASVKAQSRISREQVDKAIADLDRAEKEEQAWRERTKGVGARVKQEVDRAIPIWKKDLDTVFLQPMTKKSGLLAKETQDLLKPLEPVAKQAVEVLPESLIKPLVNPDENTSWVVPS